MKTHNHPQAPLAFDPNDPHGFGELGEHHGHHVTSFKVLLGVLIALLVLTGLTVFASQFETYLTTELGWFLPDWVNVIIAMSIAVVKATLVIMFFMALKYENPLYTVVFLFCMFAFVLFLGLTGMDLDNRGHVYPWKQSSRTVGGTGNNVERSITTIKDDHGGKITIDVEQFTGSLTERLRAEYILATGITEEEYARRWREENHIHEDHASHLSSADRSRPLTGITGALDVHAPADDHADEGDHGH